MLKTVVLPSIFVEKTLMIVWRIEGKKKNSIYLKYIFLQDLMHQFNATDGF